MTDCFGKCENSGNFSQGGGRRGKDSAKQEKGKRESVGREI